MQLTTPLAATPGVGPFLARKLELLGLLTIENLIFHFPFRYDDFSQNLHVAEVKAGETVTFFGEVWSIKNTYTRFRKVITKAILNDSTGTIEITWFNQPWLTKSIVPGDRLQVSGKVTRYGSKIGLVAPQWEKRTLQPDNDQKAGIHTGRLVPIYPETAGLTSKWLRQKIAGLLPTILTDITDPLPKKILDDLLPLPKALEQIHFPQNIEQAKAARDRLSFDELFFIQLATQKRRLEWQNQQTFSSFRINQKKISDYINQLPFKLTGAQKRVISEITTDLQKPRPMNRLLQGEVGSGKTVVAVVLAYLTYLNNLKTVLIAPTEILAFQHYQTFCKLLEPLHISIGLYTGSKKSVGVVSNNVIIGTHALLSEKLKLNQIGLVIVDEQQRFGVKQRSYLRSRSQTPHFLTMTATPIPRTVALTLYGDLDMSILDELPKGRKTVQTHFVPGRKRNDAYKFIAEHIKQGKQAYIITPLIEESETLASVRAATVEHERLKKEIFPNFKLGLLHGRMKSKEKEEVIGKFKNHEIDILVSTSVVEVGMDIPNATIMIIEGAERFGLAQLHQLRGRVGRGADQSFCLLFTEMENPHIKNRLKKMENINDGMKLSELDLSIRGSGEIFGIRQSGEWNLKIASLTDLPLIEKTQSAALKLLADDFNLDKYPQLKAKLTTGEKEIFPD